MNVSNTREMTLSPGKAAIPVRNFLDTIKDGVINTHSTVSTVLNVKHRGAMVNIMKIKGHVN